IERWPVRRGEDGPGLDVQGDDGTLVTFEAFPGGFLCGWVDGELDRAALRVLAGDEVDQPADEQAVVVAGEDVVLGPLQRGAAVEVRVVAGQRRVHGRVRVLTQERVLAVHGDRPGDRGVVGEQDGPPFTGVLVEQDATVLRASVQLVGPEPLDVGHVDQQREAQQEAAGGDPADRRVHRILTTWVTAVSSDDDDGGGAGRRAASDSRISNATSTQFMTSDEPPSDRNGVVRPVSGISLVTPPRTMNTCRKNPAASPAASSLPNGSRISSAARSPRVVNSE